MTVHEQIIAAIDPRAHDLSITLDRYGHLMPGAEAEAAILLDAYLTGETKRVENAARGATIEAS